MARFTVELNPHHGDPLQVEVEATTMLDAVTSALRDRSFDVDFEEPPDHEPQYAGWSRIQVNVITTSELLRLTGDYYLCDGEPHGTHRDDDDCCAVCGEEVEA